MESSTKKPQAAKHTPGPWTLLHRENTPTPFGISGTSGEFPGGFKALGEVYGGSRNDEYGANARLIAAAPELLEALKSALISLEMARDINGDRLKQDAGVLVEARAAIAKASGEAS